MSYNIFRNFGYLLEPVLSDLVETETHANSFVAYCTSTTVAEPSDSNIMTYGIYLYTVIIVVSDPSL